MKLAGRDFALFGIITYFTFIGGTFYSQLNFVLRVTNQVIVTLILGLWLLNKLRKKEALPRTYLDGAIVLYLAANFLSAGLGQSPRFSLEGLWFTLAHTLAFYLLVDLIRRGWLAKLVWSFYMASAVVCLVGLTEFLAWYFGVRLFPGFAQGWPEIGGWQQPIPPLIYRLAITLNGSTPLSAYLALLTPPAIGLILTLPPKDQNRQALWIWLVLASIVQILTFSRAGILALVISLTLTLIGWSKVTGKKWPSWRALWRRLSPLARMLIILSGAIIAGVMLFWLQRSFAGRVGSTQFRFTLWETALTIFQNHFLTGAGPGNFGRALLRLNQADLPRLQIASAHNVYLNMAAELGLLGLITGGYLLFKLSRAWLERWRQIPNTPVQAAERLRLVVCGAALIGLAAQTLVDTYSATSIVLVMLTLAAFVVSSLIWTKDQGRAPATVESVMPQGLSIHKLPSYAEATPKQRYAAYLAIILLAVYAAGFAWIARADLHLQRSFTAEQTGNLAEAISHMNQARVFDPDLTLHTFRLAWLEARLAAQTNDSSLIRSAGEHYQAGLRQEPIWGLNSANLSGLLWQQGRRAEAIETMQRTLAAERDPLYLINLGHFYEQEGNWAEAGAAYGEALALAPDLAGSGFWQATSERANKWSTFVEEAVKQNTSQEAQRLLRVSLALAREEFDAVEALAGPASPSTPQQLRAALAEVYLSRAQPEQASAILEPAMLASVEDYLLWGRIKLRLDDHASAEKFLKTAVFMGSSRAYYYLGQLYEQQGNLKAAEAAYQRGFSPHYISENIEVTIYGRSGGNDLIPQLLRLGVSPAKAAPWLELGRLYEAQQRFEEAKRIYEFLLIEDPFLTIGQERLTSLNAKH